MTGLNTNSTIQKPQLEIRPRRGAEIVAIIKSSGRLDTVRRFTPSVANETSETVDPRTVKASFWKWFTIDLIIIGCVTYIFDLSVIWISLFLVVPLVLRKRVIAYMKEPQQ